MKRINLLLVVILGMYACGKTSSGNGNSFAWTAGTRSAKGFQTGEFCNPKFRLLKAFFQRAGLRYGLQPPYDRDELALSFH